MTEQQELVASHAAEIERLNSRLKDLEANLAVDRTEPSSDPDQAMITIQQENRDKAQTNPVPNQAVIIKQEENRNLQEKSMDNLARRITELDEFVYGQAVSERR